MVRAMESFKVQLGMVVAGTCLMGALASAQTTQAGRFAIADVKLFDGDTVRDRRTVLVDGGKILSVGTKAPPAGVRVVAGAGKMLIPGLIDAHVHAYPENALAESLALGVTTDLDMFNDMGVVKQRRADLASGKSLGADLYSSGTLATVPHGHGTEYGMAIPTLTKPEEAQAWVDARIAEGSDYIKIILDDGSAYGTHIPTLDNATLKALVVAAHARGKLAVCHVGTYQEAVDAMEAGADGLMHLFVDRAPDAGFGALVAKHHAFVVPTLSVLQSMTGGPEAASLAKDPRMTDYMADGDIANLGKTFGRKMGTYDAAVESIHQLKAAGVLILAGTDAPNPGTEFGASEHGEMESLVGAGLTPVEAMRAATANPAKAFHLADRGRIAPGMRADLVLVSGDPSVNIGDTRNVVNVWKAGVEFDRLAYAASVMAERKAAVAAAKANVPAVELGTISDFDDGGLKTAFGAGWSESTDSIIGGKSTVKFAVVDGGAEGSAKSLRVEGSVAGGTPYPWGAVMFSPGAAPFAPTNLSGKSALQFWAKGDGGTYRVMMFTTGGGQVPQVAPFVAGPEWKLYTLPFAMFGGTDGKDVMAILFSSGVTSGPFAFQIDQVKLVSPGK
jgi:imidazolonepropionase-like amidohydrolase